MKLIPENQQNSYQEILKLTSLFGSVQVFQILIQILKSKLVAVFLGTSGIGVLSLLISTTGLISVFTSFGIATIGTKIIASANGTNDTSKISSTYSILKICVWLTGGLGMILTLIMSPLLSNISFGNYDYTTSFIWLSLTFLFDQMSSGQTVVIRGLQKYRKLANASFIGSLCGFIVSVPVYYVWGINGIVPAIIISSLLNLVTTSYFSRSIRIPSLIPSWNEFYKEGSYILRMGFLISLSGIVVTVTSFLFRLFLNQYGNLEQVGLYSAGFTLLSTYVGLIFSAMAADYFPRLSTNHKDDIFCQKAISEQAHISLVLLMPILLVFLIFCPLIIQLIYSKTFLQVQEMLYWAIPGMLFRAVSWAISYIFLAKGDSKKFFYHEFGSSLYILILNVFGFVFYGLSGVGIAFSLGYLIYFIHMSFLCKRLYGIKINNSIVILLIKQLIIIFFALLIVFFSPNLWFKYLSGFLIILFGFYKSFVELNSKIDFKYYIKSIFQREN